jgi:hypothetical protein
MCTIINVKIGSCRTINYTGDIKHLGDTLADEAIDDRELEQQILFAANEIKMRMISSEKGEQMIDELLKPNS